MDTNLNSNFQISEITNVMVCLHAIFIALVTVT